MNFETKEVLNLDEVAAFTGLSKSYIYKLTHKQQIPYYKPFGKICYFNREEITNWLQQNRVPTKSEMEDKAISILHSKK
jgi:excisionase family DNA binding protein